MSLFDNGTLEGSMEKTLTEKVRFFDSTLVLDKLTMQQLQAHVGGRGFFIPLSMAPFMEDVFPAETKIMKMLLSAYLIGVDGWNDLTLNKVTITGGMETQEKDQVSNVSGRTPELTFSFPAELESQFFRKYNSKWIQGAGGDINSGRPHYFGSTLPYTEANHTMSGIYFTTDPSEREIIFAAYLTGVIPTIAGNSMNNYKRGENNTTELAIPYKVNALIDNETVTQKCKDALTKLNAGRIGITTTYKDFTVE